jgi:hypothetical protein
MSSKRQMHDGIVGVIVTLGTLFGYLAGPAWLWLPGIVGVLLIQSYFTGFCPVYFSLDKLEEAGKLPVVK